MAGMKPILPETNESPADGLRNSGRLQERQGALAI
jgi:hypothetical protein